MFRLASAVILAALTLATAGVGRSLACTTGKKVLLQTSFSFVDAAFGDQNANFAIQDSSALIKPSPQKYQMRLDSAFLFGDIDICVTVTPTDVGQAQFTSNGSLYYSAAGIVFWAQDYDNFYVLLLNSSGSFQIARKVSGNWVDPYPVDWTHEDALVQGVNKPNQIEIVASGQSITVSINGKAATELRAQMPSAPSLIGLFAESAKTSDTWKFNGLQITSVK